MESEMHIDVRYPEAGSPDQPASPQEGADDRPQVVDWFALTEGNVPASTGDTPATVSPAPEVTLAVPSAGAIGGLRP